MSVQLHFSYTLTSVIQRIVTCPSTVSGGQILSSNCWSSSWFYEWNTLWLYFELSNWISSILFALLQTFEGLNFPFKRTCFMQGRVQEKERVVPADWTLMLSQSHWTVPSATFKWCNHYIINNYGPLTCHFVCDYLWWLLLLNYFKYIF